MNNYLFRERLLKCQVLPPEKVHAQLFKGSNTTFKKPTLPAVARYNKKRTLKQQSVMSERLLAKEGRLRKRLAEKGIDYDFPGFAAVLPRKKKQVSTKMNDAVNSPDVTPLCTPTVLKRRQSLMVIDDVDDEITFKVQPTKRTAKKKAKSTASLSEKVQKTNKLKKTKRKIPGK
ncbi:MKI67 FHA domain-interacting nucleolar phosphoprotein [Cetorhinus maximus]